MKTTKTMTWKEFCGLMTPGREQWFDELLRLYNVARPDTHRPVITVMALIRAAGPKYIECKKLGTYTLTEEGIIIHNNINNVDGTDATGNQSGN